MNQKEFWAILKKTKGWAITKYGLIRNNNCCPIEKVANYKGKTSKFRGNLRDACRYLRLEDDFVNEVMISADNTPREGTGIYRSKLIKLLKLKERLIDRD